MKKQPKLNLKEDKETGDLVKCEHCHKENRGRVEISFFHTKGLADGGGESIYNFCSLICLKNFIKNRDDNELLIEDIQLNNFDLEDELNWNKFFIDTYQEKRLQSKNKTNQRNSKKAKAKQLKSNQI